MTADLAVIAMAVLAMTDMILRHRHDMKVADRLRVVSPPKRQQEDTNAGQQPGAGDKPLRNVV